jgi:hypothetical protein
MLRSVYAENKYVIFTSSVYGYEQIDKIIEIYLDVFSDLEISPGEFVKAYHPAYFATSFLPDTPNYIFYLLSYSNGHIVYVEDSNDPNSYELMVLIERSILDDLGIEYTDIRVDYINAAMLIAQNEYLKLQSQDDPGESS